jgi:hypothetical protein
MTKTGERRLENNQTGFKLATSVGGVSTVERGDRILLDDPHNVIKAKVTLSVRRRCGSSASRCRTASTMSSPRSW